MFIHFDEEDPISYPYKPLSITYQKRSYLIVPDFFKKISTILLYLFFKKLQLFYGRSR